jgi:glutamate N-acetyltransferase/amino-acid N-acetyltransferase
MRLKIIKKGVITYPLGYKASALHSGIKKRRPDLALILSESQAVSAGVFTVNKFKAAPVLLDKRYLKEKRHRAIIINSGNANCLTGKPGLNDAIQITKRLGSLIRCKKSQILVCSTGVIGKRLPLKKIDKALPALVSGLSKSGSEKVAKAIMTTDTFSKEIALSFKSGGKEVRIAGIAKGAGMIEPNMATMLCLITTDARLKKSLLQSALKQAADSSFNNITIDGSMSTNDTVLILANGLSGVDVGKSESVYRKFVSALNLLCVELARMIVRDGEGATKFIDIEVKNAKTSFQARKIALFIANSNLFKTMCYGENPNFGRVAAACGTSSDIIPHKVDIYLNGRIAVRKGTAVCDRLPMSLLKKKDIEISVNLNQGKAGAKVWTSDLSPKYVKVNAEYS